MSPLILKRAPILPTKADAPPSGGLWLHEIKHDGFRIVAGGKYRAEIGSFASGKAAQAACEPDAQRRLRREEGAGAGRCAELVG